MAVGEVFPEVVEWSELMQYASGAASRLGDRAQKFVNDRYRALHGTDAPEISRPAALQLIANRIHKQVKLPHDVVTGMAESSAAGLEGLNRLMTNDPLGVQHFTSAAQASGLPNEQINIVMRAAVKYDLQSNLFFQPGIPDGNTEWKVKMYRYRPEWQPVPAGQEPSSRMRTAYIDKHRTVRYGEQFPFDADVLANGYVQELEQDAQEFVKGHFVALAKARDNVVSAQALANQVAPDATGADLQERQFLTLWHALHDLNDALEEWGQGGVQKFFVADQRSWAIPWQRIQNYIGSGGMPNAIVNRPSDLSQAMQITPIWSKSRAVTDTGPWLVANFGNFSTVIYERRVMTTGVNPLTMENSIVGWSRFGCASYGFVRRVNIPLA